MKVKIVVDACCPNNLFPILTIKDIKGNTLASWSLNKVMKNYIQK